MDRDFQERLREGALRLITIGAGNPLLEAQYLMAHALRCSRTELLRRRPEDPLPPDALAEYERLLGRRLARVPLQYVLGSVPFCELDLEVGPGVLIPRSETEVLVDLVTRAAPEVEARTSARRLVDIGTGSGAILLALLHRLPHWIGIGTDRSAPALAWAARNRARTGLVARAGLVRGDLCASIRSASAAVVVSNPPYIRSEDLAALPAEVRDHEPAEALDGGPDGLDPLRRMLPDVLRVLIPGGLFALELDPDQARPASRLLEETGVFENVGIHRDLAERPRIVMARRGAARDVEV